MDRPSELDFVQYLRDRELISPQLGDEVRKAARTEKVPLGRLLLDAGAITVRDLMKILALQADSPHERFGEIALRTKVITSTQLESALRLQATVRPHQLEIVRRMALLSSSELQDLTIDYMRFLEMRIASSDSRAFENEAALAATA